MKAPADARSGWMPVARLMRPQGRRGELLAEPLTDLPDIFEAGRTLQLVASEGAEPTAASVCTVQASWRPTGRNAGRVVLQLAGCDSIDAAEALAGQWLLIARAELPALEADTFFVADLVGCALFDGEARVGTVLDVHFATSPDGRVRLADAAPLLIVQADSLPAETEAGAEPEPLMIPFVRAWIEAVDLPRKVLRMSLPKGLAQSIASDPDSESDPESDPEVEL